MSDQLQVPEGVAPDAWARLARKGRNEWGTPCWAIDERDAQGVVIGTAYRDAHGGKAFEPGGKRGLILAWPLNAYAGSSKADPVWVCEGASDTAALLGLGMDAVGVPMAGACSEMLAELLAGLHAVIAADADDAGRRGGKRLAERLLGVCESVRVVGPPKGSKDVREAVIAGATREDFDAAAHEAMPLGTMPESTTPSPAASLFRPIPALELIRRCPHLRPVVIADLLREGEVMNVVAGPKVGKSWLTIALGVAVATGRPWLGKATAQGKVLLVDAETHDETLAERIEATRRWLNTSDDDMAQLEVWPVRGMALTIESLRERLKDVPPGRYRLIALDALYRFMPTDGDENSNAFMARVYTILDVIAAETGAAIVVVHHATKGSQSDKAVTDVGAGAGAQSRAADTHLILRAHEADGAVVVDAVVRSFPPVKPFVVRTMRPGWELAPQLDPLDLRKAPPRKRADSDKPEPAPVQPWTPKRFADEVVGCPPSIKDAVLARAQEAGLSVSKAESLLRLALDARLVHRHQNGPSAPHRFSTDPPERLPDAGKGEGADAPLPPGATAPGGVGGLAHPPSPLSKRGKEKAA